MMVCITVSVVISVIASLILGVLITGTLVRRVMDLAFDSTEFCMKTLITLTERVNQLDKLLRTGCRKE